MYFASLNPCNCILFISIFKQHRLLPYSKYLLYRFTLFLFLNTHPCTLFISSENQLGVETGADSEQRIPTVSVLGNNIRCPNAKKRSFGFSSWLPSGYPERRSTDYTCSRSSENF